MKTIIKILSKAAILFMLCMLKCNISYAEEAVATSVIMPMNNLPATLLTIDETQKGNPYNDYKNLKIPAQLTQQGNYYFIVDTYNNQVIYSTDMWKPINEWKVMDRNLNYPHAIASDGQLYLVTDTDNHRVLCYEYVNGRFQNTQKFDNVGVRPHYIQYDASTASFFVWSSLTGDMYIIKKIPENNLLYISEIRHIKELSGIYVRSFSIAGNEILFPSGNNCYMIVADKKTFKVKGRYPVIPEISGMAFAKKIGSYYYITVSTDENLSHDAAKMIRTTELSSLASGSYEDITPLFKEMKVPYYIDGIGGSYYVTNHESQKNVYKFDIINDQISNQCSVH